MMLQFPESMDEIPLDFEVYRKGDWQGPSAHFVGFWMSFGLRLRNPWQILITGFVAVLVVVAAFVVPAISPWWSLVGWLLIAAYVIALLMRLDEWAHTGWYNLHQCLDGDVYVAEQAFLRDGLKLTDSAMWHEGVHVYQRKVYGERGHQLRFAFDPRGVPVPILGKMVPWYRSNAEAQAYGLQVARGDRTLSNAVAKMTQRAYFMGLDHEGGRALIQAYAFKWKEILP